MASPGPAKRARGISPLALASSEDGNAQRLIVSGCAHGASMLATAGEPRLQRKQGTPCRDYRASGMTPSLIDKQMIKVSSYKASMLLLAAYSVMCKAREESKEGPCPPYAKARAQSMGPSA